MPQYYINNNIMTKMMMNPVTDPIHYNDEYMKILENRNRI